MSVAIKPRVESSGSASRRESVVAGAPGPLRRIWRGVLAAAERFLPKPPIERIYPLLGGHIYFQTLSAAVQLDLFTLLNDQPGLSGEEISTRLGIQEKPARILLLGCTNLGLLRKTGATYANSRLTDRFLVRGVPGNIVAVVEWQHFVNYRAMYHFCDSIKANTNVGLCEFDGGELTLYERLAHHPDLEQIFQDAMQGISLQANAMLARYVDLSHVRRLVDVGGGNGTNAMTLARRFPKMHATVFDAASVCRIARRNVASAGMGDRVDAVEGDCFEDDFPAGVDCILFCHFFTIWSEDKNRFLLRKAHEALAPGGSVIVFNMMQSDDATGPLTAAMGSPYFLTLATGEGMLYTWREYQTWMREAGFETVRTQKLPRDHGAIIGVKA
jgi:tRNA A58 N-methylase Trm61